MTKIQRNYSALILVILSAIGIQAIQSNNNQTIEDLIFIRNFNKSNAIDAILSQNWMKNHECLNELNSINKGLIDHEEWAIKLADSWGNIPSGILNGNNAKLGSFSECFHIERNGRPYETQYCVGIIMTKNPNQNVKRNGITISLGICLPATCTVEYLEMAVNNVLQRTSRLKVIIPRALCQLEESPTDWKPIDFVTSGLFGVVLFLMVASTGYDISYTIYNRTKYEPFVVFSIYTNGKRLFACKSSAPASSTIQCLEGMRVLSIMWIVFNHTFRRFGYIPLYEKASYDEYNETYRSALSNAPMPVNTFFALSGLLVSNKMFKLLKKDGKLDILSLYWQRYLRLTPIFGMVVLVTVSVWRFFGDGPMWAKLFRITSKNCEQYWWSTLLYVQNYVNPDELCLIPTWYLSVDTQLFIISPALVYLIHRFKKTTLIALFVSILCCICYIIPVYIQNDIRIASHPKYSPLVYYPTHARFPAWLIGFITGYILFEFPKGSIRIPKKLNLCIWTILLIVVMPIIVFANYPFNQAIPTATPLQFGLYETMSHLVWSIAVCYMIFACRYGSARPVDKFLSLPMWQPLSKLSYALYLNHFQILLTVFFSIKTTPHFSELSAFQNFISFFVLAICLAIPMTLAFELPIDAINKLIMGSNKQKRQQNTCNEKCNNDSVNIEKCDEKP